LVRLFRVNRRGRGNRERGEVTQSIGLRVLASRGWRRLGNGRGRDQMGFGMSSLLQRHPPQIGRLEGP
jgi:hypothetical protein